MKVSIIKYNAGNVYSVECALRRLGVTPVVSDSPDVLSQSDKVLFPGVHGGAAAECALGTEPAICSDHRGLTPRGRVP